jgi:hypothetical protein
MYRLLRTLQISTFRRNTLTFTSWKAEIIVCGFSGMKMGAYKRNYTNGNCKATWRFYFVDVTAWMRREMEMRPGDMCGHTARICQVFAPVILCHSTKESLLRKVLQMQFFYLYYQSKDRLCGLVVRVRGYWTEMYCVSCEVRTEFICYVEKSRPPLWSSG